MNQLNDSDGGAFDSGEVDYQTLTEAMTYDCNRQQHQSNYAMQGLTMVDSSSNYQVGQQQQQHSMDLYSSDFHNFQTDLPASYYASSNSDLMLAYDHGGHDGPSSSGLNVGQYFTSVDPMMMVQQSQQSQAYGGGGLDYTDVNNLEPSLVPEQVDAMQAAAAAANPQQHQQQQQQQTTQQQLHQQQQQQQQQHQQQQQMQHTMASVRSQQANMAAYVTANYYNGSYHSSPTGSSHTSSGTDISDEGDDMFGLSPYKRSPTGEVDYRNVKGKRQGKKRKPRKDPNEPQKPVSAYALFFRDTQAAIKGQNPNASFGEVSKIVASMWDSLGTEAKNMYKQKTESAKKEYLKQLAAYRANLLSKGNRGCMTMDPFAELAAQQRKASMQSQSTSSPDSTTANGLEQKDPCNEIGLKTLASLIAEPAPQQVLTATTTLTVPQSYTSARTKNDYSCDMDGGNQLCIRTGGCHQKPSIDEQSHWDRDYCPEECVAKNCRDLYSGWVPARQQQQQTAGAYAPV